MTSTEERKTQDIGHCRKCKGQWVVLDGTKGIRNNSTGANGQVCPYCKGQSVYYSKELNR